jgi:hypothetical protein
MLSNIRTIAFEELFDEIGSLLFAGASLQATLQNSQKELTEFLRILSQKQNKILIKKFLTFLK